MAKLGELIKLLRFKKNMTQGELGEACGVTKASISNYEKCIRNPPYPVLCKIAKVLGADVGELLACMSPEETVVGDNQIKSKRPRRVKKLLAAFDRLTDEGQLKAMELLEMVGQIPMYQKTLQSALQQYIFDSCGLKYELLDDGQGLEKETEQEKKEDGDGSWYSVRHLQYYNKTKKAKPPYWDFFYCTSAHPLEESVDYDCNEIISFVLNCLPDWPGHMLVFVFDDTWMYSSVQEYYETKQAPPDGRDFVPAPQIPDAMFLLADQSTWEIKDEQRCESSYEYK